MNCVTLALSVNKNQQKSAGHHVQNKMDKAYGCMLGAFAGDAAGAGLVHRPNMIEAARGLSMPGGAQITQASELALCLAYGLLDFRGWPAVANQYRLWLGSAISPHAAYSRAFATTGVDQMLERAREHNGLSAASGALVRITPAVVFCQHLADVDLVHFVMMDARLSHPKLTVQHCNAVYAVAISHLFKHSQDRVGAMCKAKEWAARLSDPNLQQWLHDAETGMLGDPCLQHDWVRWPVTLSFFHLCRGTPFISALFDVLCRGGNTSGNAAVVGGMMGAFWGARCIPAKMARTLLQCNSPARGEWLDVQFLPLLCDMLFWRQ